MACPRPPWLILGPRILTERSLIPFCKGKEQKEKQTNKAHRGKHQKQWFCATQFLRWADRCFLHVCMVCVCVCVLVCVCWCEGAFEERIWPLSRRTHTWLWHTWSPSSVLSLRELLTHLGFQLRLPCLSKRKGPVCPAVPVSLPLGLSGPCPALTHCLYSPGPLTTITKSSHLHTNHTEGTAQVLGLLGARKSPHPCPRGSYKSRASSPRQLPASAESGRFGDPSGHSSEGKLDGPSPALQACPEANGGWGAVPKRGSHWARGCECLLKFHPRELAGLSFHSS